MLTLNRSHLAALIHCSAVKDVRHYMNGALLEVASNGDMHLISTDGKTMFCGLVPAPYVKWTGAPQAGSFSIIIPLDALKVESKGKLLTVDLVAMPDGRYTLGNTLFSAIDGTFPDWRRVAKMPDSPIEPGQYKPELLLRCHKALKVWFSGGANFSSYLHQFGPNQGIMTGENMTGFCAVMPVRGIVSVRPFTPAPK